MDDTLDIEPERAIELAKEYLAGNWLKSTRDTVSLKVISGGFCSSLYLCSDSTGECKPSQFLIRIKGGKMLSDNDPVKQYNEGTESIVFFMHGHLGYGPKLYGVFTGGRLEEYIPSRALTDVDLQDKDIRMQVARKLARFHSMKLPVSRKPHPSPESLLANYKLFDESREVFLQNSSMCDIDPSWMELLDFPAEINWFSQTVSKIGGRLVLSTNDMMNRVNVLIRDTPDSFDEIVTIIDYEIGGTNWRAYDIACHFALCLAHWRMPGIVPKIVYADENIRLEFIEECLRQTKAMGVHDDYDAEGLDSPQHILMEVDFLSCLYVLFIIPILIKPQPYSSNTAMFYTSCRMLAEFYVEQKQYLLKKYVHILNSTCDVVGKDVPILKYT